jgi:DNA-binding MarR family transcriptional regulator
MAAKTSRASVETENGARPPEEAHQWVFEGVRQYAQLQESADSKAIAVHLALWEANHARFLATTRAIEALNLPVSVSGSRLAVLRTLYCAPQKSMALSAISKAAGISPTMVTNLIDGLAKAGLVRRAGSPDDRRVSIAQLTPEGEETFHKVLPVMTDCMMSACAGFTEEEKDQLLRLLQRLF